MNDLVASLLALVAVLWIAIIAGIFWLRRERKRAAPSPTVDRRDGARPKAAESPGEPGAPSGDEP